MISIFSKDTASNVHGFCADTESEITNGTLPTTHKIGENELKNVPVVSQGSWCITIDTASVYMLNSEDEWVKL